MNQTRQIAEREIEGEYPTAEEVNVVDGAASNFCTQNMKPDVIGETNEEQEPRHVEINQQTSLARMDQLARGLYPTVSPVLKSLTRENVQITQI